MHVVYVTYILPQNGGDFYGTGVVNTLNDGVLSYTYDLNKHNLKS